MRGDDTFSTTVQEISQSTILESWQDNQIIANSNDSNDKHGLAFAQNGGETKESNVDVKPLVQND